MLVKELIKKLEECDQDESVFVCSKQGEKCESLEFVHPEIALYTEEGDEVEGGVVLSNTKDLM